MVNVAGAGELDTVVEDAGTTVEAGPAEEYPLPDEV